MCCVSIHLERSQQSGSYDVSPGSAHRTRIRVDNSDMVVRSIKYQKLPLPPPGLHSLQEYALSHGLHHLAHINPGNRVVLRAIKTLHSNAQKHPLEWDRLCSQLHYTLPSLKDDFVLFILIAFAPAPLLRSFIGRTQLKWKDGTNPLIYAARFGKIEHARILLSSGVSLNCRGWDLGYFFYPLRVAVGRYDLQMVNLFLAEGGPVPNESFVKALNQDLPCFPAPVVSRLLQTDEFVECAADLQDEGLLLRTLDPASYRNSFHPSSQQDIDVIQRRLIQLGCDPPTQFNETSLRYAASTGFISIIQNMLSRTTSLPPDIILDASRSSTSNVEMIRLCLDVGSDVHTVSPTEDTVLHVALTASKDKNCLEDLQVLIEAGCNPSRCNLAGETPLHLASRNGSIAIVKYLLALHVPLPPRILLAASESHKPSMIRLLIDSGADVHAIAPNGDTPLHRALSSWYPSLDCVKVLISPGCNPYLPNALGKTPFDIAAEIGDLSVIQYLYSTLNQRFRHDILLSVVGTTSSSTPVIRFLLDKGASIHVTNSSGDTLLHLVTAHFSDTECLRRTKLLVHAGCDPHACNLAGEMPFHFAAREGHILVMEYLLSLGISLPSNIMHTQLEGGRLSGLLPVTRFLLEKGGDIHTVTKNGDTLLHLAASAHPEEDALELAKHLVRAGCIQCVVNSLQETPLRIAARNGFISFIKYLLSLPNTALPLDILLAASTGYSGRTELIRYLVEEGANVSVATTDGDTPLHLVIRFGGNEDRLECVKILVDAGCNPGAQNLAGETPLHAAARRGFNHILEYFTSCGIRLPDDILLASGTLTTIRFLVSKGLDLGSVAADDVTKLMHYNLEDGCAECARVFTSVGWDPALRNAASETAIHVAVRKVDIYAVKFFLSQNVPLPSDILLATLSPLSKHLSGVVHTEHTPHLTRFLIREGASVNVAASNGNTPLHLVMMRYTFRLWELIEILLNAGSDPSARNVDGQTPYDLAEAKGHFFKENFLRLVRNSRAHVRVPK
ncbi:ankyrin repeat-containing domain protein [Boletus coccyginus]|nr:ankyrin repeat-containing domain protein [Boletus coccyginus]